MPFFFPWTDQPSPELERGALQFVWRQRAEWKPEAWHLPLVVSENGELVGVQGVQAKEFRRLRLVETGSWLGRAHQGRGIGKEMRAAVLHLAFAGLGADSAYSAAWEDNAASLAVSRALGYEENGDLVALRRDRAGRQIRLKLHRDRWQESRRDDIAIESLEPCLGLFGAG
jgi:RimJ/RimL family protein N-acetyltransferase